MATTVASLQAVLSLDKSDFDRGIKTSTGLLEKIGTGAVGIGLNALTGALTGVGQAAIGMAEDSLKASTDLEQQMSGIAAVMGLAKDEVEPLREVIDQLALSPDLTVSTFEAADSIEMLGKNGLKVTDIMQGAAEATVQLSNATGGDFAQSADVMTDVLQLWNKEFRDGKGNIRDMTRAVDRISAVVVTSKFDLNDFSQSLAQGGGVAAASGVEFDDFAAVVAGISSSFASGSDAGTSFKTMLQRLAAPTDAARDLMAEMGFSAYDAAGNLKPMIDIVDGLNDTFKRMDEETKAATLTELFGSDAMRAASALAGITREEFAQLQAQMADVSAAEQAATRMDNLAGSMDVFQGVVESLKVQLGDEFNPILKSVLDETIIPLATEYGPGLVDVMGDLAQFTGDFINAAGEAESLKPLVDSISTLGMTTDDLLSSMSNLGEALGFNNEEMTTADFLAAALRGNIMLLKGPLDQAAGWAYAWSSALDALADTLNSLREPLGNLGEWAKETGTEIGDKLKDILPGSPVPMAVGLSAVKDELTALQAAGRAGLGIETRAIGGGSSAGNAGQTTILNLGGQSFSFQGENGKEQALAAMLQMLRQQLSAA